MKELELFLWVLENAAIERDRARSRGGDRESRAAEHLQTARRLVLQHVAAMTENHNETVKS